MADATGKVFGLFDNGKAEWVRWLMAMAMGAAMNYAIVQSRIAVLESRIATNETNIANLTGTIREDIRELRRDIYTMSQPPARMNEGTNAVPADRLPKFQP